MEKVFVAQRVVLWSEFEVLAVFLSRDTARAFVTDYAKKRGWTKVLVQSLKTRKFMGYADDEVKTLIFFDEYEVR